MKRCPHCGHERLSDTQVQDSIEAAGHVFTAPLPARRCAKCGEASIPAEALAAFERLVAATLAQAGESSNEALRFMRKSLGMRAADLAELLDVTPETLSRWETGKLPVERRALAILGSLVMDRHEGRTATLERLRALREPRRLGRTVRLKLQPAS